jgi:hypothetical protein
MQLDRVWSSPGRVTVRLQGAGSRGNPIPAARLPSSLARPIRAQPPETEPERQAFAERALREFYAEGLIYFFRIPPGAKIEPSSKDEGLRLASDEVESALRGDWWRGREQLGEGALDIWFGPTEAGEAAAVNPPDYVRKH